jgi:UDP-glucose 4-epimerase
VVGKPVPTVSAPPRPGDPKALVADVSRAKSELGWTPTRELREIIASTVAARRA